MELAASTRIPCEVQAGHHYSAPVVHILGALDNQYPLTATLSNVPASHDGSSTFTFDLAFSENVRAGYARIRDHAFTIDEGDIEKAQRKVQGSNRTWTIEVEPDGN